MVVSDAAGAAVEAFDDILREDPTQDAALGLQPARARAMVSGSSVHEEPPRRGRGLQYEAMGIFGGERWQSGREKERE